MSIAAINLLSISPEFLEVLIKQHGYAVRAAARANDPDHAKHFPALRDQLAVMKAMLPDVRNAWAERRAAEAQLRRERIIARFYPAERQAAIDAINDGFGKLQARPWQDDMSGVRDPDSIGAEAR